MKFKLTMFLVLIIMVMVSMISQSLISSKQNPLLEKVGKGEVNWMSGTIKVTGIGAPPPEVKIQAQARPMAKRAAVADAYRNFLEIVNGVRVDSETIVENLVVKSDVIRLKVDGYVKGAKELKTRYMSDGTIEVDMELPLHGSGGLGAIVLPEVIKKSTVEAEDLRSKIQELERLIYQIWERLKIIEEKVLKGTFNLFSPKEVYAKVIHLTKALTGSSSEYSGLVIDCSGLGVKPAMSPKVIAENGEEVYGIVNIKPEIAIELGVVAYVPSFDEVETKYKARVGDNPLMVKAIGVSGYFKSNPVVSAEDAEKIKEAGLDEVLANCAVALVVN